MSFLTRRGARSVTADFDRLANLIQHKHLDLGIPEEYAKKFAYFCDTLSDRIERHAIKMAEEHADEKKDEPEGEKKEAGCEKLPEGGMRDNCEKKKSESGGESKEEEAPKKEASVKPVRRTASAKKAEEAPKDESKKDEAPKDEPKKEASKKKADDETGLSVDHGASGFDANVIADEVSGPKEIIQPPSEPWMNDFFTQGWFQELGDLQEAGSLESAAARGAIITKAAQASVGRLRRLASTSRLAALDTAFKGLHAKLATSELATVQGLATDVQKQIVALNKIQASLETRTDAALLVASDKIAMAMAEQAPYLKQVVSSMKGSLDLQKQAASGPVKDVIALGTSIVVACASDISKQAEMPDFIKEKVEEKKDEDKSEKKDEGKSEKKDEDKKEASEEEAPEEGEAPKDEKKEASEEEDSEEDSEEESDKTASTFGYDLFTA